MTDNLYSAHAQKIIVSRYEKPDVVRVIILCRMIMITIGLAYFHCDAAKFITSISLVFVKGYMKFGLRVVCFNVKQTHNMKVHFENTTHIATNL